MSKNLPHHATGIGEQGAPVPLVIDQLIRQAPVGKETAFDVAEEILPDGKGTKRTFTVINRELNPEPPPAPVKFPSPKRVHNVYDIDGFAAYLKKYGTERTVVFANPALGKMSAVLDEGAYAGFEIITFTPQIHPVFAPWNDLLKAGAPIGIKKFVDFIANNRRAIIRPVGRELIFLLGQVRMSRKVELQQGDRTHSVNGIMVETLIEGKTQNDFVEIPEVITIYAPIYLNTDVVEVEVDLTLGGNEQDGVFVRLSAGDLLQKRSDLFDKMFVELKTQLGEDVTVTTGEPAHAEWKVIEPD